MSANSREKEKEKISLPFTRTMFLSDGTNIPIIQNIRDALKSMRPLPTEVVIEILVQGTNILKEEPNVLKIRSPIIIAGDIHGQFFDLLNIFAKYTELPRGKYLFLGDYVDRGNFSIETVIYLVALKIRYPNRLFLLRGNHETRIQTTTFTFLNEVKMKYNIEVFNKVITLFDSLPLAAIIDGNEKNRLFCIHGGLAPDLKKVNCLDLINRFHEPQKNTLMHDILWSDPHPNYDEIDGIVPSSFQPNFIRNCSYFYTFFDVCEFLKTNNFKAIVRAHTVQTHGYRLYKKYIRNNDPPNSGFPSVFSIFSAPNYCNELDNQGSVLYYDGVNASIIQFAKSPEPYILPDFTGLFEWIIPMVGQQITEMWQSIWESTNKEKEVKNNENETSVNWHQKMESLGKICDAYKEMTHETESHFEQHKCEPFKENRSSEQDEEFVKDDCKPFENDEADAL